MADKPKGLYPALLAVQAEAPTLQKTAINPHFKSKFVPLDVVTEAVMPILNKNGLVWMTLPGATENGSPILRYSLVHSETLESIEGAMALLPSKADPQGQGSAITYARRYALMAVLGLVADEDDDGNAASKPPKKTVERVGGAVIVNREEKNLAAAKPEVHNKESFEKKLADKVTDLPGTTELATKDQLTKLAKAKDALGVTRFEAYLRAQGADSPEELTKEAAESVLTWARAQAKKRAA